MVQEYLLERVPYFTNAATVGAVGEKPESAGTHERE